MNTTCLIIDDEKLARELLREFLEAFPEIEIIGECSKGTEAVEQINKLKPDLIFLDVQMPELTGISLLKVLQKRPLVVLTTAYSEYALEGYELDVADYLLKPITFERFLRAVDKVTQRLEGNRNAIQEGPVTDHTNRFVFVKDGTKLVKVQLDDILYIEGLKDYVTIHTKQQKVVSLQRMKALEEQLNEAGRDSDKQ